MDIEIIIKSIPELVNTFSALHAQSVRFEKLYDGQIEMFVPKGYKKHIPPTAPDKIHNILDHTITSFPVVTVPPLRDEAKAEKQADYIEVGDTALLQRLDAMRPTSLWRGLAALALICPPGILKGPLWDKAKMGKEPKRKKGEKSEDFEIRVRGWELRNRHRVPIEAHPVRSADIIWDLDRWPPSFVIEKGKRKGWYVKQRWGAQKGWTDDEDVEWTEIWTTEERRFVIGTGDRFEVVSKEKVSEENELGYIPYQFVSNGLGRPSSKPEDQFRSVLYAAASSLESEARIKTALEAITTRYAFPAFYSREDPSKIEYPGLGEYAQVPEGYEPIPFPSPDVLPDLYRMAEIVMRDVERSMGPEALGGMRTPGVTSGYQEASLIGQGRLRVIPLLDSLNNAAGIFLGNVHRLIEVAGEEVVVWGMYASETVRTVIKPKGIADYVPYVSFEGEPPEEADRKALLGFRLWQGNGITLKRFWEKYLKISNVTQEFKQMLIEEMLQHPVIRQVLAQFAVEEWGMKDMLPKDMMGQPIVQEAVESARAGPQGIPGEIGKLGLRLGSPAQGGELGSPAEIGQFR